MSSKKYQDRSPTAASNPEDQWIREESLLGQRQPFKWTDKSDEKGEKSAEDMLKDMLRGVNLGQETNPYYSKDAQQNVANLLTSEYKRNNYISSLEQQLPRLPPSVSKNYNLLILLLKQSTKGDIAVVSGQKGIEVTFNPKIIEQQQAVIDRLRKQQARREEQRQSIVKQYEAIIGNLQRITEQLIKNKEEEPRQK